MGRKTDTEYKVVTFYDGDAFGFSCSGDDADGLYFGLRYAV